MAPNPRPIHPSGPSGPHVDDTRLAPPAFPTDALGPTLAAAVTAVAAQTQAPTALIAHHILTLATVAAQRLIALRLPTGALRPVSCFFVSLVGTGEGRGAAEKVIIESVREWERAAEKQAKRLLPSQCLNLFADPRLSQKSDRYRNFTRQPGLFARHVSEVVQTGAQRRTEAASLCALWDGKVVHQTFGPAFPRLVVHLVTPPRGGRGLLRDADLEDAGLLGRLLVAAPASTLGARTFHAAENDDPPPALRAALSVFTDGYTQSLTAEARVIGFAPDAAARWFAYAQEVEAALAPGAALAPIRAFAVHLAEHAARLAAVAAWVEDAALTELNVAHIESGIALARFYTQERLRFCGRGGSTLDEHEQEDVLREWLERWRVDKVVTLRDVCRSGPREVRDVDTAYKLMRRMERSGLVQRANDVGQDTVTSRRARATYAWRLESEKGHVA